MSEELRSLFRDGAAENLVELEEALLKLGENPEDSREVNRVFRVMHTIKGSAGMLGFSDIARFAHCLESEFDEIRKGQTRVSRDVIRVSLQAKDQLFCMVEAHFGGPPHDPARTEGILRDLRKNGETDRGSKKESAFFRVRQLVGQLDLLHQQGGSVSDKIAIVRGLASIIREIRDLARQTGLESIIEFLGGFETVLERVLPQKIPLPTEILRVIRDAGHEALRMFKDGLFPDEMGQLDPEKVLEAMQKPLQIIQELKQLSFALFVGEPDRIAKNEVLRSFRVRIFLPTDSISNGMSTEKIMRQLRDFGKVQLIRGFSTEKNLSSEAG